MATGLLYRRKRPSSIYGVISALSVDWSKTYATIARSLCRKTSFLRLMKRGIADQVEAPTLWDIDFATAVAQA